MSEPDKRDTLRPPALPEEELFEALAELDLSDVGPEPLAKILRTVHSYHSEFREFRGAFWRYVEARKEVEERQEQLLRRVLNALSVATVMPPAASESAARAGDTRLVGIKVLFVDDDQQILAAFGRLLGMAGARVTGAASAEEALDELGVRVFDVAIVDVSMPGMGGPEFVELIADTYPNTKPIILSGYSREMVFEDIMTPRLVALDVPVLEKPVSQFSDLVEAIQKAARRGGG